MKGIIKQVNPSPDGQKPHLNVLLQDGKVSHWLGSWNRDHWPFLTKGLRENAELYVQKNGKWNNVVGLKKIKTTEFDTDGKTPIIQQKTREAGGRTLYD